MTLRALLCSELVDQTLLLAALGTQAVLWLV